MESSVEICTSRASKFARWTACARKRSSEKGRAKSSAISSRVQSEHGTQKSSSLAGAFIPCPLCFGLMEPWPYRATPPHASWIHGGLLRYRNRHRHWQDVCDGRSHPHHARHGLASVRVETGGQRLRHGARRGKRSWHAARFDG